VEELLEKIKRGEIKLYEIEEYTKDVNKASEIRRKFLEETLKINLEYLGKYSIDLNLTYKKNIENAIGCVQIPLGIAGPLLINGDYAKGLYYIPLATTEGALVASVNRGCSILTASEGVRTKILDDKMTRAPLFKVKNVGRALEIIDWINEHFQELIGTIDPLESEERILARKIFLDTHDPKETLKYFPEELLYERIVLEHLLHNPNDFLGALAKLPTLALRLFIEAYSSYLFNRFLSKRICMKMFSIEEGDLVSPLDAGVPVFFSLIVGSGITKERAKELLSKDRIAIVLPVLGYKVKISGGIMGDLIREILIGEGIRPSDFKIWLRDKFIGLKGSYRRIDLKPLIKLSYRIIKDEIFNTHAVQLSFALYRGCYATVLLREIMKHPFPGSYFGKILKGA